VAKPRISLYQLLTYAESTEVWCDDYEYEWL